MSSEILPVDLDTHYYYCDGLWFYEYLLKFAMKNQQDAKLPSEILPVNLGTSYYYGYGLWFFECLRKFAMKNQ